MADATENKEGGTETATEDKPARSFESGFPCPIADCKTTGSMPGLKRHLAKTHGKDWHEFYPEEPKPERQPRAKKEKEPEVWVEPEADKPLADRAFRSLQTIAKHEGVEGFHRMKAEELVPAIEAARKSNAAKAKDEKAAAKAGANA